MQSRMSCRESEEKGNTGSSSRTPHSICRRNTKLSEGTRHRASVSFLSQGTLRRFAIILQIGTNFRLSFPDRGIRNSTSGSYQQRSSSYRMYRFLSGRSRRSRFYICRTRRCSEHGCNSPQRFIRRSITSEYDHAGQRICQTLYR